MTKKSLDPTLEEWKEGLNHALKIIDECHRRQASDRGPRVGLFDTPNSASWLKTVPEEGLGIESALDDISKKMLDDGGACVVGNHFAYIPSASTTWAAIGDLLASYLNRYTGVYMGAKGGVQIHNDLIDWLKSVFGFPSSAYGVFQSGGTIANFSCIHTARVAHDIQSPEKHCIYMSVDTHGCIEKSLRMAGLHRLNIRKIEVDEKRRVRCDQLEAQIASDVQQGLLPWMIVGNAGTTNTGAIDDLERLSSISHSNKTWFHVDGAFGGLYQLTDSARPSLAGIEKADSLVVDPHKSLCMPFGLGVYLVRERKHLAAAFTDHPEYINEDHVADGTSPMDYSPELTRPFRSLKLWLVLQTVGTSPIRAHLEERLHLAQFVHQELKQKGYEMIDPDGPQLSTVAFRKPTEEATKELESQIVQRRKILMSSTQLSGQTVLRLCMNSHYTDREQVIRALNEF